MPQNRSKLNWLRLFAAKVLRAGLMAVVLVCQTTFAGNEYLIDTWTAENGLPNSSVTSIAQTPDGYLWVGTYNGLARFDGVGFVTFDPANTPSLQSARVRKLYVDHRGTLWVNTYDGSLTAYRDNGFTLEWKGTSALDTQATLVSSGTNDVAFLLYSGELIRRVETTSTNHWQVLRCPTASSGALCCQDGSGVFWYRGRNQQLWRLAGDQFELVPTNAGLKGKRINALVTDAKGRVWVGTEKEVAVWSGKYFQDMTPTNGAGVDVSFLFVAPGGDVWAVADGAVRKARGGQWTFEADDWRGVFTGSLERMGAQEDASGGVWFYHYGKGLFHARADGRTRQLATEQNFPGERVDCFFEDREGNLWTGVDRGGLVRIREKRFQVFSIGEGPLAKGAVSVCEDSRGVIWVGSFGGGLNRWESNTLTRVAMPSGAAAFVFSVFPDAQQRLWMSAGEEDVFFRDKEKFTALGQAFHGAKAIHVDGKGRVWVGRKSGLVVWDKGQTRSFQPQDGVQRLDIRALAEDAQGAMWAGAGDGTLYRIETGKVSAFRPADKLASLPIWSLLADADGTIWVGTFRGGLLFFKDGLFTRCTTKNGLADDVICQLLDDDQGHLWIGSQRGIFRVAKSELHTLADSDEQSVACTSYGRYDGLPALECSGGYQPASWRARDGRLWFTTLKGVVSVQPADMTPNRFPPPVAIENAVVDGESRGPKSWVQETRAQSPHLGNPPLLEIPPGKQQVEFHYTGLSFVSPDRVRFRYRLEGLDKDWNEAGTHRSVQYGYLKPGKYLFRVTACNNDGVWNPESASLAVTVLPHFYETRWFLAAVGLLAVAVVFAIARHLTTLRLRREMEQIQRQRAVERDRTRIAKDIHDDVGSGLIQIALLSELARRDPPQETEAHLGQISEAARELTRAMDEIVWAVDPKNDTLDGLVTYICKFAQQYLNLAGIRCRLDLPEQLPLHPLRAEIRHNLFLAIKESLNNVIKHAHATEVHFRLVLTPGGFTIVIEDNGRGFNPHAVEPNGHNVRTLSGHGLGNLRTRLETVGGDCRVNSRPDAGTRVEMNVKFETGD